LDIRKVFTTASTPPQLYFLFYTVFSLLPFSSSFIPSLLFPFYRSLVFFLLIFSRSTSGPFLLFFTFYSRASPAFYLPLLQISPKFLCVTPCFYHPHIPASPVSLLSLFTSQPLHVSPYFALFSTYCTFHPFLPTLRSTFQLPTLFSQSFPAFFLLPLRVSL
jgi:hypothetical protein